MLRPTLIPEVGDIVSLVLQVHIPMQVLQAAPVAVQVTGAVKAVQARHKIPVMRVLVPTQEHPVVHPVIRVTIAPIVQHLVQINQHVLREHIHLLRVIGQPAPVALQVTGAVQEVHQLHKIRIQLLIVLLNLHHQIHV